MAARIDPVSRWHYNGLDCCATIGLLNTLTPFLTEQSARVYRAEMALEACTLAIQSRGIRVDTSIRSRLVKLLDQQVADVTARLATVAGHPVNPNSPAQIQALFYAEMDLTPAKNKEGRISVDRSVLERISKGRLDLANPLPRGQKQPHLERCAQMADLVLESRSLTKDRSMVNAKLDGGRIRTSLNVGATESFRFSASTTHFHRGANLQQVRHDLREMYVPDPGMEMVYGDQDRAESMVVAYLSGDPAYIQAHVEGDTHTTVAKMIWPDEPWPNTPEGDDTLARKPNFMRFFSRRDLSKRVQHGLNYLAQPVTVARTVGCSIAQAQDIYDRYYRAFPGIGAWQRQVIEDIRNYGRLYYPGGFYRDFFGRPWDPHTHREAISSVPQAIVAWTTHLVMFRLWLQLESSQFHVLSHNHDAVLLQCADWRTWAEKVMPLTVVPWPDGRNGSFSIPWSWAAGANWKIIS